MPRESTGRIIRFGSFEVDLQESRLTKAGVRIRLQEQPFQILTLLLERPGQLVTREEIRQKLWAQDTFVEFDDALNTAVRKLRAALNDSADNPRFLETVPRRGYRFVAPVTLPPPQQQVGQGLAPAVSLADPASSSQEKFPAGTIPPTSPPEKIIWRRPVLFVCAAVFVVIAGVGTYWYEHRPIFQITTKDTIILADFVNTTGEAVFDDALRQGLEIGLAQSPFVQTMSDRKAAVILRQMGHSAEERMSGRTAIEVCQRSGGKITVQGSITSLGTTYLIGLAAIRCDTGEPIANEQVEAKRKEDVVDALGQATARLRARLGESLPSIRKYNAPLELATTPSLDALNAYGVALSTWDRKGNQDSLPLFKRAIELDPNFAMAYSALATIYNNLGEEELARKNATRAYELRDRVTESEKVSIEARYHLYVTGDLERAAQVYELAVQTYPHEAGALNHLGTTYGELGYYEKAVDSLRQALLLDPARATTYSNLAIDLLALNRQEEAAVVLAEADKRKFHTDSLLQVNYWEAFLHDDSGEMQRLLQQASDIPGAQSLLLSEQSDTEAYRGHFEKADELSRVAANLMGHDGDKEASAVCLAQAAVRDAEVGESTRAREFILSAQKLSHGEEVAMLSALALARIGDVKEAEALSEELDKRWPAGTYIQKYWLPALRAEIDLHQERWSKAVDDLNPAVPLEFASPPLLPVTTIYPAYVRGQAYLQGGDGSRAAAEFQKLTDRPGMLLNFPLGVLARLGRARAYSRTGEKAKARS
ncbi:MAG: winged helix-turn-helix domain-containing protein, partial [Candidatus Sulfotelmatobacter sp.]